MQPADIQQKIKILKLIWGALFSTSFIYFAVVTSQFGPPITEDISGLLKGTGIVFSVAALGAIFLGLALPVGTALKVLLSDRLQQNPNSIQPGEVFGKLQVAYIVKFALLGASMIYGLSLCFILKSNYMWLFSFFGAFAFIVVFPASSTIEKNLTPYLRRTQ